MSINFYEERYVQQRHYLLFLGHETRREILDSAIQVMTSLRHIRRHYRIVTHLMKGYIVHDYRELSRMDGVHHPDIYYCNRYIELIQAMAKVAQLDQTPFI